MLQRAANNAYSWWWASHIRTKQSKWLEQSLQDMEEKTQYVLGLIQEEGDSFAKRAEMYYKRRPELIHYVEESYKGFRALAERYDHLSTELQNANNTLATCFPEQFQLDDDCETPKAPQFPMQVPPSDPKSLPKAPSAPLKNLKGIIKTASKQLKTAKTSKALASEDKKSGLNKSEATDEIDKLQKDILALQTVKEFVKSSYQTGLEKYYSIESTILEKQQRVGKLKDEFGVEKVMEDDEARKVMAEAALKSCQDTLLRLQETQKNSAIEAKDEVKKIEDACQRIKSIKNRYLPEKTDAEETQTEKGEPIITGDVGELVQEKIELQFDASSMSSITVSELAEKIDELVTNVISLENSVSSQSVLIERLRSEAGQLHANIQTLEDDKSNLTEGRQGMGSKVKELEEKLRRLQNLNRKVESRNSNLDTHFTDAQCSLNNLSKKLSSVRPDEEESAPDTPSQHHQKNTMQEDQETKKDEEKQTDHRFNDSPEKGDVNAQELPDTSTSNDGQGGAKSPTTKTVAFVELKTENNTEQQTSTVSNKGRAKSLTRETVTFVEPKMENNMEQQTSTVSDKRGAKSLTRETVAFVEPKTENNMERQTSTVSDKGGVKSSTTETVAFVETKTENNMEQQTSTVSDKSHDEIKNSKEGEEKEELNWQMILLSGEKDREKILVQEYTTILKKYKDMKKKQNDIEKKNNDERSENLMQLNEMKYAIGKKDEEIQNLRRKLNAVQGILSGNTDGNKGESPISCPPDEERMEDAHTSHTDNEGDDDFSFMLSGRAVSLSPAEEALRVDIDSILDENLGFWLRFSTAFHQIQKFRTTVEDLQEEISQIKEKKQQEDNDSTDIKSEVRPLYKHLKEIQAELTIWMEKSGSLKEELERRFSSVCGIQERISVALKESVEKDDIIFSSHQAAKFQGEVLNMKQENNRVKEELKSGFEQITSLKGEVDTTLIKLTDEFSLSDNQTPMNHSRSGVPLRSFLFGAKVKQKKHSIFSLMHPNRKYQMLRAGLPP